MRIRNFLFALIIVVGQIIQVNEEKAVVIEVEGDVITYKTESGGIGLISTEGVL